MQIFYQCLIVFGSILFGYLFGCIQNGVIIGKVFFHKDIRQEGSGNSGGTNAGRILGKKVGIIVIVLDVLKTIVPMWITYFVLKYTPLSEYSILPICYYLTGIGSAIGHCYPVFSKFKGGKAVSTLGGFCLGTNWALALLAMACFMIVLKIKKYVSLSSMLGSFCAFLISLIPFLKYTMNFEMEFGLVYSLCCFVMFILVIIRHIPNISKLKNGTERKITWMK